MGRSVGKRNEFTEDKSAETDPFSEMNLANLLNDNAKLFSKFICSVDISGSAGRLKINFDFDPVYSCGATKRRGGST